MLLRSLFTGNNHRGMLYCYQTLLTMIYIEHSTRLSVSMAQKQQTIRTHVIPNKDRCTWDNGQCPNHGLHIVNDDYVCNACFLEALVAALNSIFGDNRTHGS